MQKSTYSILLFLLPLFTLAQKKDTTESIADRSKKVYSDSVQFAKYRFAKQSSYYLADLMPLQVNRATILYNFQRGNFIQAQGATTINKGNFSTEGATNLGSVKVFGSLDYQKVFEDSTSYAHQTRSNTTTSFYYGSPAYVHYERTIYAFNAMASKSLYQNRLDISLETNYKIGDHFSTNDPRGSIGEYQFNLKGIIAYRFSSLFKAGLGYMHGYGRERVNIGYKNPRYYESSTFPIYYTHKVNGYNEWKDWLKERAYQNKMLRNGMDAFIDFHSNGIGNFYLNGSYFEEKQHYFSTNSSGFTDLANYNIETTKINLLWNKNLQSHAYGAIVNYQNQFGKDYHIEHKANNYIYDGSFLTLKFYFDSYSGIKTHNYYLAIEQNSEERVDGVSNNRVYYNNMQLSLGYTQRYHFTTKHDLSIGLTGSYKLPVNSDFKVLQDPGYFTQNVINRDYIFNTATVIGGALKGVYGFPVFSTMKGDISLNCLYLYKADEKAIESSNYVSPGKDRFYSDISLNLYF